MTLNNRLPIPKHCDNCCSVNVIFTTVAEAYGTNTQANIYYCEDCFASVGVHENTLNPLGKLADKQTRRLRSAAHYELDKLWLNGFMSRDKAYQWLANALNIDRSQCHISWLSKDQLRDSITLVSSYIKNNLTALQKRKVKSYAKFIQRSERERRQELRSRRNNKSKRIRNFRADSE